MAPTAASIAAFLGREDDTDAVDAIYEHLTAITELARSYTRGGGFVYGQPADDISAVITCATARLLANPEQVPYSVGGVDMRGGFTGWSLAEQAVLNRYRRRAA